MASSSLSELENVVVPSVFPFFSKKKKKTMDEEKGTQQIKEN